MQFVNQLLQFLQQGLAAIFHFIEIIWQWSVTQISAVPWNQLGDLPWWKVFILVVAGIVVAYLLYRAARELLDAGEKALSAFVTLLTVFVRTLPPILLAGGAAAAGAWVVTHVNL
jgi:type VI protein secretion system component VasF